MAAQDLLDIWEHVWRHASALIADKQLREIDHVGFALGAWPEYGKAREDVRKGLRSAHVSRYVLFYRVRKNAIEIVRVLDERRDVDSIFSDE